MRGDYVKALAAYTQALYRNRRLKSEYAAAHDLLCIGITAERLGENNRAVAALNEGVEIIEKILIADPPDRDPVDYSLLSEAYRRLSMAGIRSGHLGAAFSAVQKGNLIERIEGDPSLLRKLPTQEQLRSSVGESAAALALGGLEHSEKTFILVTSDTVHAFVESDSGVVSDLMTSYGAVIRKNYRKTVDVTDELENSRDLYMVRRNFDPTSEFAKIVDFLQLRPGPETSNAHAEIQAGLISFLFGRIKPLLENQSKLLVMAEPRLRSLPFGRIDGEGSASAVEITFVGQLSDTLFR
jgi:tetratricopeptide (TPR) repeat protein